MKITKESLAVLAEAEDLPKFIQLFQAIQKKNDRNLFFSDVARRMGFQSRSYARALLLGHKPVPMRHVPKLCKALGLTGDVKNLFELLIERQLLAPSSSAKDHIRIKRTLENTRSRLMRKRSENAQLEKVFALPEIPLVYAALGQKEKGASIPDIIQRTHLSSHKIQKALTAMLALGLISKNESRFFASATHVDIEGLNLSKVFQEYFIYSCNRAAAEARRSMNSDKNLFLGSSFSVRQERLSELKNELSDLLLKYVDRYEDADGTTVVSLVCGLYS